MIPRPPRVGIWCAADADRFGDALRARVLQAELTRRVAGLDARPAAPFGDLHPSRFDDGLASAPLGVFGERRMAELAAELDAVVVTGDALIGPDEGLDGVYDVDPETLRALGAGGFAVQGTGEVPVLWLGVGLPATPVGEEADRVRAGLAGLALVGARDRPTADALLALLPAAPVEVVGDPLLLAHRLLDDDARRRRLAQLRATGAHPPARAVVVLLGPPSGPRGADVARAVASALAGRADLAAAVGDVGPGPSAANAGRAAHAHLPPGSTHLGAAGSFDILAAVAAAAAIVTDDAAVAAVATGAGVPVLPAWEPDLGAGLARALDDPAALPDPTGHAARLEAAIDLAAQAVRRAHASPAPAPAPAPPDVVALLVQAHTEALRRAAVETTRVREELAVREHELAERARLMEHLEVAHRELGARYEALGKLLEGAGARAERAEAELRRLRHQLEVLAAAREAAVAPLEARLKHLTRQMERADEAAKARMAELAVEIERREERARAADAEADRLRAEVAEMAMNPGYRAAAKAEGVLRRIKR